MRKSTWKMAALILVLSLSGCCLRKMPIGLPLWDGRIYYMLTGANIYSMNLDGSGRELVLDVDRDRYK